jgi:hypothetical protein
MMGDDVGMWNIGAYHQGLMAVRTPNLDRLAADLRCRRSRGDHRVGGCVEAYLQGGQALLAINYLPNWKAARGMGALLQHHRAKEMALDGFALAGLANPLCHSMDVVPERLPLACCVQT